MTLQEIVDALDRTKTAVLERDAGWTDQQKADHYLDHIFLLLEHPLFALALETDGYRAAKSRSLASRAPMAASAFVLREESARLMRRRALVEDPATGVSTVFEHDAYNSIHRAAVAVVREMRETRDLLPRWLERDQQRLAPNA